MAEIVVVTAKCFKYIVNPPELAMLLDTFLQQQGYEVQDVVVRIEEEEDATEDQVALHPPRPA